MSDLEQKEETIVTTEPVRDVDVKEILESTKLNVATEELLKMKPADLTGSDVDEKIKQLYTEFSSFLETSGEISPDSGIKNVVPTPIDLVNAILGGGFACGSMSIILGVPGGGKSCLAGQLVASLQERFPGALAAFLDSEEATTTLRLYNLGVRKPPLKPYNDITVEKVFKFLEGLCLFKEQKKIIDIPSLVIWDSIANTLSQKEREAEDINSVIGYKARVLSILIPKYVAKLARFNIALVAVNQLRDLIQIGNFTPPKDMKFMPTGKDMPGGNILKFNAFQMLNMKVKSVVDPKKLGFEGQIVEVACIKNKLFMPNVPVEIVGNFVTGFNNFWSNYNFLVKVKRLESGAWNYLVTLPTKKFRTIDVEEVYKTDLTFKAAFDEAVKEAIQKEIIEKNTVPI
jgi:RecA/RadA recombinase